MQFISENGGIAFFYLFGGMLYFTGKTVNDGFFAGLCIAIAVLATAKVLSQYRRP